MKRCHNCNKKLAGRQEKWCSRKCQSDNANIRNQNYQKQQERAQERKAKILELKGDCCQNCGYYRATAALTFHHRDPSQKLFPLDARNLSNRKWSNIIKELEKCDLLCFNCHMEEHHGIDRIGKN